MYIYQKRQFKSENTLLQWSLQNILENQTFQRRVPFIMVNSYEMAFMSRDIDRICREISTELIEQRFC